MNPRSSFKGHTHTELSSVITQERKVSHRNRQVEDSQSTGVKRSARYQSHLGQTIVISRLDNNQISARQQSYLGQTTVRSQLDNNHISARQQSKSQLDNNQNTIANTKRISGRTHLQFDSQQTHKFEVKLFQCWKYILL